MVCRLRYIYIKKTENDVEYVYSSVRKVAHTKNVQIVSDLKKSIHRYDMYILFSLYTLFRYVIST